MNDAEWEYRYRLKEIEKRNKTTAQIWCLLGSVIGGFVVWLMYFS